jgi:hypothetical protein
MSGGHKKAATQRARGKYSNYKASGRREQNKASRITTSIMRSGRPTETARKVIEKHPNAAVKDHVRNRLKEGKVTVENR